MMTAIYDITVNGFRPAWRDYGIACAASVMYVAVVLPIDLALGANYGFLGKSKPCIPASLTCWGRAGTPADYRAAGGAGDAAGVLPWIVTTVSMPERPRSVDAAEPIAAGYAAAQYAGFRRHPAPAPVIYSEQAGLPTLMPADFTIRVFRQLRAQMHLVLLRRAADGFQTLCCETILDLRIFQDAHDFLIQTVHHGGGVFAGAITPNAVLAS
jgi:hypothetical protein